MFEGVYETGRRRSVGGGTLRLTLLDNRGMRSRQDPDRATNSSMVGQTIAGFQLPRLFLAGMTTRRPVKSYKNPLPLSFRLSQFDRHEYLGVLASFNPRRLMIDQNCNNLILNVRTAYQV